MFPFSMDVMFDSDSIVVTSLAVTYPTLKSGSKVYQDHCLSNSSEILGRFQTNTFNMANCSIAVHQALNTHVQHTTYSIKGGGGTLPYLKAVGNFSEIDPLFIFQSLWVPCCTQPDCLDPLFL